MSINYT